MTVARTARERVRLELLAEVKAAGARQLADVGAAGLSLRAVARDLGLASSAVYRYVPSRDALLTLLIVDAYDELGAVAEAAAVGSAAAGRRWLDVCRAVRGWAREHPHSYALLYGSPVPGYAAPLDTIEPAVRLTRVMITLVREAALDGTLQAPSRPLPGPALVTPEAVAVAGGPLPAPYGDVLERSLVLVVALVGALTYELFGHLRGHVTDDARWFDRAMAVAADGVGLVVPFTT